MQVRLALEVMFEGTKGDSDLGQVTPGTTEEPGVSESLRVGGAVSVSYKADQGGEPAHVVLQCEGGSTSDMVADAVIAIILQVSTPCYHGSPCTRLLCLDSGAFVWGCLESLLSCCTSKPSCIFMMCAAACRLSRPLWVLAAV